ncbi:predicted protein [Botrytis cinerea T4]|uniref:Uncharacterized protein n=1 Tax=Botryotinia fuckeliana (strain T4) TaxID=999810 RepID=G2Y3I6_BOTF4|nr:predicted protein [Botrytis cinerea T4]
MTTPGWLRPAWESLEPNIFSVAVTIAILPTPPYEENIIIRRASTEI